MRSNNYKKFEHIAMLIKRKRQQKRMSQHDLAKVMGFKNGQFVSNVERGLCGIPHKKLNDLINVLNIEFDEYVSACQMDLRNQILKAKQKEDERRQLVIIGREIALQETARRYDYSR